MSDPKNPNLDITKPAPADETPPAESQAPKDDKAKPKPGLVSEAPYSPLKVGDGPYG
jgi:hypothetical protein